MTKKYQKSSGGFTLVELSIVLIIIAILTIAVISGGALLKQSRMNSIITDYRHYLTAFNTFRGKYSGFPGDLKSADDVWGTDCGTALICRGDNNGLVDKIGTAAALNGAGSEVVRAWKHLQLAGMVESNFDLITTSSLNLVPGKTAQGGKFKSSVYFIFGDSGTTDLGSATGPTDQTDPFADGITNALYLGVVSDEIAGSITFKGVLTPIEAFSIDQRADNGVFTSNSQFLGAKTGVIRAITGSLATSGQGCVITGTSDRYDVSKDTDKSLNCIIALSLN